MKSRKVISLVTIAVILVGLAWIHYEFLSEAYGGGPPHYGRTTNMDKWENPWPLLLGMDLVALVAVYFIFRLAIRPRN